MAEHDQSFDSYVTVKLFAWLRDLFGWSELRVPIEQVPDVRRLLEHLSADAEPGRGLLKESGAIKDGVIILLNGQAIDFAGGMQTGLTKGDELAIFPPISGG